MAEAEGLTVISGKVRRIFVQGKLGVDRARDLPKVSDEQYEEGRCIVNPGFFRTELLTPESTTYAMPSIEDYADRHAARVQWYEAMHGQQTGDPAKLARALITIASQEPPPRRFIAGADAIAVAEQKVAALQEQIDAYRDLSMSLALDVVDGDQTA